MDVVFGLEVGEAGLASVPDAWQIEMREKFRREKRETYTDQDKETKIKVTGREKETDLPTKKTPLFFNHFFAASSSSNPPMKIV